MRVLRAMLIVFIAQLLCTATIVAAVMAVGTDKPVVTIAVVWGLAGVSYIVAETCLAFGVRRGVGR